MSTRCNILVGHHQFYHHYDGYPEGVGRDLAYFLSNINSGYLPQYGKDLDGIAMLIRDNGIPAVLGNERGRDREYQEEPFGLHGDIEYLYLIDGNRDKYRLWCVSVPFPISETDIYDCSLEDLFRKYCKPRYEITLPSPDVPEEYRRYHSTYTLNGVQAKLLGLKKSLGYGQTDWESGLVRVRSVKRRWRL